MNKSADKVVNIDDYRDQAELKIAVLNFGKYLDDLDESVMDESEIIALCNLADSLVDLDIYEAWEYLGDYALDFIDDIESPPDWFESLHDIIREIKLTLDVAKSHERSSDRNF